MLISASNFDYKQETTEFLKLLNLLSIENNTIISIDGSYSAVYRITGTDYYLKTDAALNYMADIYDLFLSLLPSDVILTFIYKIGDKDPEFIENYRRSANPPAEFDFIKENKIRNLETRTVKKIDIYLYATIKSFELEAALKTGILPKIFHFVSSMFSLNRQDVIASYTTALEKLGNLTRNLAYLTSTAGIKVKRLNDQEIFDYLFNYLNPDREVNPPLLQDISENETLRSALVYSPLSVNKNYISVGSKKYKFINMHKLPKKIDTMGITELLNLSAKYYFFKYTVAVSFYVPEQEKRYKDIQTDGNIKQSMAEVTGGDYIDYKGETEADTIKALLQSVAKGGKKLIDVSLAFMVEDDLKRNTATIIDACKHFNTMEAIDDTLEYRNLFLSFLPGTQQLNFRKKTVTSKEAANFFPLQQGFKGTNNTPIALFNARFESVSLDLIKNALSVKHGNIFGKSRSGKGFTMNEFLSNYFLSADDIDIVGVDIGGTYEKFTKLFNGNYVDIELDGRYNLNPFPYKKDIITAAGDYNPEILNFLSNVIAMMVLPNTLPEPNDYTIIARAISSAYNGVPADENPTFSDVNEVLFNYKEGRDISDTQRAAALAKNLFRWTDSSSPYLELINRKGTLDLSNRINVFDLQKIKDYPELQKLVFAIIKNLTFKKMYDRQKRVIFYYDECWEFLKDPVAAAMILHLYKSSAKWGCAAYSITQEPKDLLKTDVGRSIIEQSSIKIFLHLDVNSDPADLYACGLNEKETQAIHTLMTVPGYYSEYFMKFGDDSMIIRNEPAPFEYWLYCKSKEDFEIENKINLEYPKASLRERLEILADRYPHGPYGEGLS